MRRMLTNRIADEMDWLPTTRYQDDPFYSGGMDRLETTTDGSELARSYSMEVHKVILARLRDIGVTKLNAGAKSFEEAEKGAATEIALEPGGKWLDVANISRGIGHCGVYQGGETSGLLENGFHAHKLGDTRPN